MKMNRLTNKIIALIVVIGTVILATIVLSLKNSVASQSDTYNIALDANSTVSIKKPDFANIQDVKEKKKVFIEYILASIDNANKEICAERTELKKLITATQKNKKLDSSQQSKLDGYNQYYKIKDGHTLQEQLNLLEVKIGTAPTSFILAQAILESGWGSSRFAKDYSNYFGLHCFRDGCGVKASGADVYLEVFENASQSVLGYYNRLNTGTKFKNFRETRQKVNLGKLPAVDLLNTLEDYSELEGDEYKIRLENVIRQNKLNQYDDAKIC